jgi:hypothetical protein
MHGPQSETASRTGLAEVQMVSGPALAPGARDGGPETMT